jgi:hypothetical protein
MVAGCPPYRGVKVSDHALLRYLERVKGVDVEAARAEIVDIIGAAAFLDAPAVTHAGHVYAIKAYTVVTVLPHDRKAKFSAVERHRRHPVAGGAP